MNRLPWRQDLWRAWSGLGRVRRRIRSGLPDVGIGQFAAESPLAAVGYPNRYRVALADAGMPTQARSVTLVIDVHTANRPGEEGGHVGFATKRLMVPSRGQIQVHVCYNWQDHARFWLEGAWLPADDLWIGQPPPPGFVAVTADLRDGDDRQLDRTVVYQEARPTVSAADHSEGPTA